MNKHEVRDPGRALAYITDCNLATVADMAMKKSRSKSEFERQILIAQTAVDWMVNMKIDFSGTRVVNVVSVGSVEAWAAQYTAMTEAPGKPKVAKRSQREPVKP